MKRLLQALWRPWLLHAAGIAVVLVVAFDLLRIPLDARTPEAHPAWNEGTPSVAAVIVSRAGIEAEAGAPPPFSQRDWGLAWTNTVQQEIGPCRVLDAARLSDEPLDRYGLLVVTRGARGRLDAAAVARLAAWVASGGGLIAELPGPELAALTGLSEELPPGRAQAWLPFAADPAFLAPREGLARLPLWTRLPEVVAVPPGSAVLGTLAGRPAFLSRPHGEGVVVTVLCDFGLFLVATQQGRPEEDYTVVNRYGEHLAPDLKTADLMADGAYRDNDVPLADLLERALVAHVRGRVLVPALAPWPDGAPGVYLMTHDDESRGAKAQWMPDDEAARGVPSTIYYIPTAQLARAGPDRDSVAKVAADGHAVGLHWVRGHGEYALRRLTGLPKLGPFMREIVLPGQAARVAAALPDRAPVRHTRIHYLLWDREWARPFAQLAAAGIALDSSYGPDFNCKGYLFGTAYPFHPLDASGLPFPLWELPYQHSEMEAGADAAWLAGLAARSREGDHAAIVSLFHPPFFAFAPSAETYRMWRDAPGLLATAGHPALTMEQVRAFVAAREGTELAIVRDGGRPAGVAFAVPGSAAGLRLRWRPGETPPDDAALAGRGTRAAPGARSGPR